MERKTEARDGIKRGSFAAFAILLELIQFYVMIWDLTGDYPWIPVLIHTLVLILVLEIYGRHINTVMKVPWILSIAATPLPDVLLYLLIGLNDATHRTRLRYGKIEDRLFPLVSQQGDILEELGAVGYGIANQFRYLSDRFSYPVYHDTGIYFYPTAEEAFAAQLEASRKAERFIFMEYHATEKKNAFRRLFEVFSARTAMGTKVRLSYDDIGSIWSIDHDFVRRMEAANIRTRVFNPMMPFFSASLDRRNHRKITVIDGKVGFIGDYNLAEEYFNITHPYGHQFDTGIRLTGEVVRSPIGTFLKNWNPIRKGGDGIEGLGQCPALPDYCVAGPGYCQLYADSPLDHEQAGENVYMDPIDYAKYYTYFMAPYLVIADGMSRTLCLVAKRGVDVHTVTPEIPDKEVAYQATRSCYNVLACMGVRIYKYTLDFMHVEQCVADDGTMTCGTINLDFHSLYHHLENGVLFYRYRAVFDIKQCFWNTLPQCREITERYLHNRTSFRRTEHRLLRLISPLL